MPELSKLVEESAAETILATFSAGESEEFGFDTVAARFEREHATIFIVGVSDDLHQSRSGAELANLELQAVDA